MEKINQTGTKIFGRLLKKLNGKDMIELNSGGFMRLVLEDLQTPVTTSAGSGKLYSLGHYYQQNGDRMADPEMTFIVVDNREQLLIYPRSYRQDSLDIYEVSIYTKDGQVSTFIKAWQHAHVVFANQWLVNIRRQRFLK